MTSVRDAVRSTVERAATGLGFARRARSRMADRVVILAYHNVVPDDYPPCGDVSLHLRLGDFREQLDFLTSEFDVIPLADIGAPGESERPRAAITFDDGYRGAARLAPRELEARHLPGTMFVCPGLIGGGPFWWDRVAGPGGRGLERGVRTELLTRSQGDAGRVAEVHPHAWEVPSDLLPATLDELRDAGKTKGFTFGSHTWSHPNLTQIANERLASELVESRSWLEREDIGEVLPGHLTFPYGLFDHETVRAAGASGYEWLYRVDGGISPRPGRARPAVLPRVHVPAGVSLRGFELRVSGLRD